MSEPESKEFVAGLFSSLVGDNASVKDKLQAIKTFAYNSFDKLDGDKNGYLDREELIGALVSEKTSPAEREFISFLLNNQEQIADAFDECDPNNVRNGISRQDLDAYFQMILNLF